MFGRIFGVLEDRGNLINFSPITWETRPGVQIMGMIHNSRYVVSLYIYRLPLTPRGFIISHYSFNVFIEVESMLSRRCIMEFDWRSVCRITLMVTNRKALHIFGRQHVFRNIVQKIRVKSSSRRYVTICQNFRFYSSC